MDKEYIEMDVDSQGGAMRLLVAIKIQLSRLIVVWNRVEIIWLERNQTRDETIVEGIYQQK